MKTLFVFIVLFILSGCVSSPSYSWSSQAREEYIRKATEELETEAAEYRKRREAKEELQTGIYYVNSDSLNVRLAPNIQGKKTNTLYKRQKVDVYEISDGWARISDYYDGSLEGLHGQVARWVYGEYLSKNKPKTVSRNSETVKYSTANTYSGCRSRGVAYFKMIGSYPYLTDGRDAESVAMERCGRTKHAFDFN